MGQLPVGAIELIQNENEAKNYKNNGDKKIAFVTQTTLSVDDTQEMIKILKKDSQIYMNHQKKIFVMQLLIGKWQLKILQKNVTCFL